MLTSLIIHKRKDIRYDSQKRSSHNHHRATHQNASFRGPRRQMGAGAGGLGAFAMRVRGIAFPILRRYNLLVAEQIRKFFLEAAITEIGQVLAGKKVPSSNMLKSVPEITAKKSVMTSAPWFSGHLVQAGGAPQWAAQFGARRLSDSRMVSVRVAGAHPGRTGSLFWKRQINVSTASLTESIATTPQVICKSNPTQRSWSDNLSEGQFARLEIHNDNKGKMQAFWPYQQQQQKRLFLEVRWTTNSALDFLRNPTCWSFTKVPMIKRFSNM